MKYWSELKILYLSERKETRVLRVKSSSKGVNGQMYSLAVIQNILTTQWPIRIEYCKKLCNILHRYHSLNPSIAIYSMEAFSHNDKTNGNCHFFSCNSLKNIHINLQFWEENCQLWDVIARNSQLWEICNYFLIFFTLRNKTVLTYTSQFFFSELWVYI